jgi:hypothetical protein
MKNQAVYDEDLMVGELTEKEIKTVEKFHRQLSSHSILSIRTEDGLDGPDDQEQDLQKESISQEEALVMKKVLTAFGYSQEDIIVTGQEASDGTDGKTYDRLSSSESYEHSYRSVERSSTYTSRFVSPGRFYVRVSQEIRTNVKEVHEKIKKRKPKISSVHPSLYSNVEVQSEVKLGNSIQIDNLHQKDVKLTIVDDTFQNQSSRHSNLYPKHEGESNVSRENSEFRTSQESLSVTEQRDGNATNGHARWSDYRNANLSQLPPRERFQELVKRAVLKRAVLKRVEDRKKRQEFNAILWKKRGQAGWLDLIFTIIGLFAFFADSGTDLKVASDHFTTGNPWWGTFTLLLVFFPTVLVNLVSYFFYKEDGDCDIKPKSGWKAVKITHILQVGLVER